MESILLIIFIILLLGSTAINSMLLIYQRKYNQLLEKQNNVLFEIHVIDQKILKQIIDSEVEINE